MGQNETTNTADDEDGYEVNEYGVNWEHISDNTVAVTVICVVQVR